MEYTLNSGPVRKSRYKIGFLDDNFNDDFHSQILSGIFKAATELDVVIIRFSYYSSHIAYRFSHQVDMVLDHIEQYDLDGLVFLGWTQAGAMYNYEDFLERFKSIALMSIGTEFDRIPSVIFRGDQYVRETLLHMISVHKAKKIAMIEHFRPDNRGETYLDTMKEKGLYNPDLYVSWDDLKDASLYERAKRALEILLDERGIVPEAIMTLTNIDAMNLLNELKQRGINVPSDMAVTSYEDSETVKYSTPGLTTVYFPWMELGYHACYKIMELLKQGHVQMPACVRGSILYRASCGCLPHSIKVADAGKIADVEKTSKFMSPSDIKYVSDKLNNFFPNEGINFEKLVETFNSECINRGRTLFISELAKQLRKLSFTSDYSNVQYIVSVLRKFILPYLLDNQNALVWAGDIFLQAQALISEKTTGMSSFEKVNSKILDQNLQEISQALIANFSIQNLMDSLEESLPKIKIPSCYIFISNSIFDDKNAANDLFENSILIFDYSNGIRKESRINKPSSAKNILGDILSSMVGSFNSLAYLLHVTDEMMGFVLFEAGPMDERIYQTLTTHLSTALKGSILMDKLDESYKKLVEHAQREGMADIAADVLHNIGNILNSISVSVHLMEEQVKSSMIEDLIKANNLLYENMDNLPYFITSERKGKLLMQFYVKMGASVEKLQTQLKYNTRRLSCKVGSINEIIEAQQNYAGVNTVPEELALEPILEDAVKVNSVALEKYRIEVTRDYRSKPRAMIQRAKLFFVLVNLINNAKDAMVETPADERKLQLEMFEENDCKCIRITDSGCGLSGEMRKRLFDYGFSTKSGRHGFGLHCSASYMAEMGGTLTAASDEPGKGASFLVKFNDVVSG